MTLTQQSILSAVLESMGEGVVVADADGRFQLFNPMAQELLGLGSSDIPPEHWSSHFAVFLPEMVTPFPTDDLPLLRALRGESVDDVEMFVRRPSPGSNRFNAGASGHASAEEPAPTRKDRLDRRSLSCSATSRFPTEMTTFDH
jgi:PAS domain-containing protein